MERVYSKQFITKIVQHPLSAHISACALMEHLPTTQPLFFPYPNHKLVLCLNTSKYINILDSKHIFSRHLFLTKTSCFIRRWLACTTYIDYSRYRLLAYASSMYRHPAHQKWPFPRNCQGLREKQCHFYTACTMRPEKGEPRTPPTRLILNHRARRGKGRRWKKQALGRTHSRSARYPPPQN